METTKREEFIAGLGKLLAFYREHEEVPAPRHGTFIIVDVQSRRDYELATAGFDQSAIKCGGPPECNSVWIDQAFGGGVALSIWLQKKDFCRPKTEKKIIVERVPITFDEVSREVETIVGWECEEPGMLV